MSRNATPDIRLSLARAACLAPVIALAMLTAPSLSAQPIYAETPAGQKPRVVITADPELDDSNSLLRYLLYTPDVKTEGLIYASSQFHWKGDGKGTTLSVPGREYTRGAKNICPCTSWRWAPGEQFIDDDLDVYAKAWPNLRVHNPAYPAPEVLRATVRWGNVDFDGEMDHDTPGSDLIKKLLLDADPAPIYLHAWGGQSTIARALKSIEDQYKATPQWAAIRARVVRKAVIHPSGDQDDTYAHYIKPNWPDIRYRTLSGAVPLGYNADRALTLADAAYYAPEWTRANISARGPMGGHYRVWGDGKQMVPGDTFDYFGVAGKTNQQLRDEGYVVWTPVRAPGTFLGEGDTGTFLNLIGNGLNGYRGDSLGGWGGAQVATPNIQAFSMGPPPLDRVVPRATVDHPFVSAAQNDFAARMSWAVTPAYAGANHPPVVTLAGPSQVRARPGQALTFAARASDPDGQKVALRWWVWQAAGTYPGQAVVKGEGASARLTVPADAKPGQTLHLIAQGTDGGTPALTRYAHVVVTVAR